MKIRIHITLFYLFFISFLFSTSYSHDFNRLPNYADLSNYKTIDSAYMKLSYQLTYLKDALDKKDKSEDLQILLIGQNTSKYYSQYALDYNHFVMEYIKTHDAYPRNSNRGAWSFEVFKNYPQGKITVTDMASTLQQNFIYEEEWPTFDWEINKETETILSYKCQKATTTFRGRNYVAWFTMGIPVPIGPWKFGGLPGAILKLYDTEENFIYECIGVEQLKEKEPIKFYQLEYNKVTRKDLNKVYQRFHNNVGAHLESIGHKFQLIGGGILSLPYNPIELE